MNLLCKCRAECICIKVRLAVVRNVFGRRGGGRGTAWGTVDLHGNLLRESSRYNLNIAIRIDSGFQSS